MKEVVIVAGVRTPIGRVGRDHSEIVRPEGLGALPLGAGG